MTFQIHYDSGRVVHLVSVGSISKTEIKQEYYEPLYGTIVKIVASK